MSNLRKINDLPLLEEVPENATVVVEVGGVAQRAAYGAGVSSWNDLIDKPFYTEVGEILGETTVTLEPEGDESTMTTGSITTPFELVVGNTYTVNYNGTEYNCVCTTFQGMPAVGDVSAFMGGTPTGEPFMISDVRLVGPPGVYGAVGDLDGATQVTFSIVGEIDTKLDERYLPTNVPKMIVVDFMTNDSGGFSANMTFMEALEKMMSGYILVGRMIQDGYSAGYTTNFGFFQGTFSWSLIFNGAFMVLSLHEDDTLTAEQYALTPIS